MLYTSMVQPSYPLLVDTSFYNSGSTLNNVMISGASGGSSGWLYTQQTYDWKGRPRRTTNTDETYKEASYSGCGCAGGEVVTLTDEGTLVNGVPQARQQKIYSDVLGRTRKTEVLNWNGTVYSTTTNAFNARDQVTAVRQYQGSDISGVYQDTTMSYDGYGRLKTKHAPEQQIDPNNSSSTDHTTWDYYLDDTILKVTDARGATATYGYNARHLVNSITYTSPTVAPPGSAIPVPTPVSFAYDGAGNRTSVNDGTGTKSYQYDQLSRLETETRTFSGPGAPSGSYALSYQYTLAGAVKRITDPTNMTIKYNYDNSGRINGVTGENTLAENVSSYASNFAYRAWGGLRDVDYGNVGQQSHSHFSFNQRLQPTSLSLSNVLQSPYNQTSTMTWNYDYHADGRTHHAYDVADDHFDRAEEYDHAGRLKETYTGREARGLAPTTPNPDSAYRQTMQYDVWGNMTSKAGRFWRQPMSDSFAYTNNRGPLWRWQYDAQGNMVNGDAKLHTYDAANQQTQFINWATVVGGGETGHQPAASVELAQTYDVDGLQAKRIEMRRTEELVLGGPQTNITENVTTTYCLYSSVLGGAKVVELNETGQKTKGYVYANDQRLAKQEVMQGYSAVTWHHPNAGTNSWVETNSARYATRQEMDSMDAEVGLTDPYQYSSQPTYLELKGSEPLFIEGGDPFDYVSGYTLNGMPMTQGELNRIRRDLGVSGMAIFDVYRTKGRYIEEPRVITVYYSGSFGIPIGSNIDTGSGHDAGHGPQSLNYGPITAADLSNAADMIEKNYEKCRKLFADFDSESPLAGSASLALAASQLITDDAAMIAGIWQHESGINTAEYYGDAGPAQLTRGAILGNARLAPLVVGNAYGDWNGRTYSPEDAKKYRKKVGLPFRGSEQDNLATLRNIIRYNRAEHGSNYKAAYWYGPGYQKPKGSTESAASVAAKAKHNRTDYANDIMRLYGKYKPFFDCLMGK